MPIAFFRDEFYEEARIQRGFLDLIRWETVGDRQLLKDSLDSMRAVRRKRKNNPIALSETGYIRYVLGEGKKSALSYVFQALEAAPDHEIANNVLALLYLYLGYYESNVKLEKEKVIVVDPAYVYPFANAALAYQLVGNSDNALTMAQKALDSDALYPAATRKDRTTPQTLRPFGLPGVCFHRLDDVAVSRCYRGAAGVERQYLQGPPGRPAGVRHLWLRGAV